MGGKDKDRGKKADGHYLSPGVYIDEVSSGSKPIEGVGTSVAAFVGLAPRQPVRLAAAGLLALAVVAAVARALRS